MNKFDFTDGEWKIKDDKPWLIIMPEKSNSGVGHKYIALGGGNYEANARLILCAPEMLKALYGAVVENRLKDFETRNLFLNLIEKATGKKWEDQHNE